MAPTRVYIPDLLVRLLQRGSEAAVAEPQPWPALSSCPICCWCLSLYKHLCLATTGRNNFRAALSSASRRMASGHEPPQPCIYPAERPAFEKKKIARPTVRPSDSSVLEYPIAAAVTSCRCLPYGQSIALLWNSVDNTAYRHIYSPVMASLAIQWPSLFHPPSWQERSKPQQCFSQKD